MMIDPKAFMQISVDWMRDVVQQIDGAENNTNVVIVIDDKVLKGSPPGKGKKMEPG